MDAVSRAVTSSGRGVRHVVLLGLAVAAISACSASPPAVIPAALDLGTTSPVTEEMPEHVEPSGVSSGGAVRIAPPASLEFGEVEAPVVLAPVGADGSLLVPDDVSELGWWIGSAPMGVDVGTTLIAGHVDSATQGLGVFAGLLDAGPGDGITVVDGLGTRHDYVVDAVVQVVKSDLPPELFRADGPRRLALVTCSGPFDAQARRYRDNLIVWAVPA